MQNKVRALTRVLIYDIVYSPASLRWVSDYGFRAIKKTVGGCLGVPRISDGFFMTVSIIFLLSLAQSSNPSICRKTIKLSHFEINGLCEIDSICERFIKIE